MNIQYAIFENTVYVLEANPRASRTVPLVSKICNISMARIAMQVMLGKRITDLELKHRSIPHYGIKEAVFPFNMFPEVDPILGPEMRSTGEVLGISHSYGRSFFKAQEATQVSLPLEGSVLFTIADRDKSAALEAVRLFKELDFKRKHAFAQTGVWKTGSCGCNQERDHKSSGKHAERPKECAGQFKYT
jgi:carbamoyl-phosphate synthase large subunit